MRKFVVEKLFNYANAYYLCNEFLMEHAPNIRKKDDFNKREYERTDREIGGVGGEDADIDA